MVLQGFVDFIRYFSRPNLFPENKTLFKKNMIFKIIFLNLVVGETILSKYRSLLDKFADCVDEKNKVCEINKKKVDEIEMRLDQKYPGKNYFIMLFFLTYT